MTDKKLKGTELCQLAAGVVSLVKDAVGLHCGLIVVAFNQNGAELQIGVGANVDSDVAKRVLECIGKGETVAEGVIGAHEA